MNNMEYNIIEKIASAIKWHIQHFGREVQYIYLGNEEYQHLLKEFSTRYNFMGMQELQVFGCKVIPVRLETFLQVGYKE